MKTTTCESVDYLDTITSSTAAMEGYEVTRARIDDTIYYTKQPVSEERAARNLGATTLLEHLDIPYPDTFYDPERNMIASEDCAGDHPYHTDANPERDTVIQSVIGKVAAGDVDIQTNILVDDQTAYPIDFDKAGNNISTYEQQLNHEIEDLIRSKASLLATCLEYEPVDRNEVERNIEELLNDTDTNQLQHDLKQAVNDTLDVQPYLDNIERLTHAP